MLKKINKSLSSKIFVLLVSLSFIAMINGALIIYKFYQKNIDDEKRLAATQISLLFQASLENAMLKRDLPGLNGIIDSLANQENVERVFLINVKKEVRFASDDKYMNLILNDDELNICDDCLKNGDNILNEMSNFIIQSDGMELLRSVKPIRNKAQCFECHGSVLDNPVNGVLIVDYKTSEIAKKANNNLIFLSIAAFFNITFIISVVIIFFNYLVLAPLKKLGRATKKLSEGNLEARVKSQKIDEIGVLSNNFDMMAQRLEDSIGKLKKNQDFLQSIIDIMPFGIRVIDSDYNILMTNNNYWQQIGVDKIINNDEGLLKCYLSSHKRDQACVPSLVTCPIYIAYHKNNSSDDNKLDYKDIKSDESKGYVFKDLHVRENGESFYVDVAAVPARILIGEEERDVVIEVIRDLSLEIKLSQEQRLSEIGNLAAGVAHEIYNPLSSIRIGMHASLKLLKNKNILTQKQQDELREYLAQVDGEIDKSIDITERLLKLSMAPSERMDFVHMKTILSDMISLIRYEAKSNNIILDLCIADNIENDVVLINDSDIRMLLLNLMQNGFHAMPDGGVLKINLLSNKDDIIIEIIDEGVGIDQGDIKYIFDPFFSKRADGVAGTGLGLSICKVVVERYLGSIKVSSKLGEGTKFVVKFSLVKA